MKISIIVPIYNVESYLDKCIKSILAQTFKDFELILVDDGSPDNCGIICDKYFKIDDRIKVIHKKNGGLSSARNAGLEVASGEYIAFVDSDDWIEKTMYEEMYSLAKKNSADIVQCKFIQADNDNIKTDLDENREIKVLTNLDALRNLYNERYVETVVTWNKLYKRSLFNSIQFPTGRIHEDEFTTHKLLYKANKVILLEDKLYYYRKTPNSITNSKFNKKRLDKLDALNERLSFFKKINNKELYDKTIKAYGDCLKGNYLICKDLLDDNKSILKEIKKKYNYIFKQYITNEITYCSKLISLIFFINPEIYKIIQKIRNKKIH